MGVFENVEVMGRSGADLETELLHHETNPPTTGATVDDFGGQVELDDAPGPPQAEAGMEPGSDNQAT